MKKKSKIVTKTWTLEAKVKVKAPDPVAVLTPGELAYFIVNEMEMGGLRRALARNEEERRRLWEQAGEKYGFPAEPKSHSLDLKTGEITKAF